ncbi:MAG TPA: glycosyltransferase family 9 protein [Blastocatellia bacterium]|nr:glycosyltransferase family 9 protein [Blastocatellia bacterium]
MHILIIKLSAIGDVVLTLPAVSALRKTYPDASITWVVDTKAGAILEGNPQIDRIVKLNTSSWGKNPFNPDTIGGMKSTWKQLRDSKIDIAIDFQGLMKSALVARLSGAKRRIGFATNELRERASRHFLTEQIGEAEGGHMIEKNLRLAEAAGARPNGDYEFPIFVSQTDDRLIKNRLQAEGIGDFAILNPGGGWVTKLWAPEKYGQLARWLWKNYGFRSVVTYGPGEEPLAESVVSVNRNGVAVAMSTSLKQFVALARRAKLMVSGDTGPMHLAAAVRTPIVAMFGPTAAHRNGPFSKTDETVGRDVPCRTNCYRRTCNEWICMEIPLADVQSAIEKRLEAIGYMPAKASEMTV